MTDAIRTTRNLCMAIGDPLIVDSPKPKIYQASYPASLDPNQKGVFSAIWNILSYVIFPIAIVRFCLRNYLFSKIYYGTSPWKGTYKNDKARDDCWKRLKLDRFASGNNCQVKEIEFQSPDGALIKGVYIERVARTENSDKVIYIAAGQGDTWERMLSDPTCSEALKNGYSVFMINPRGVGESDSKATRSVDNYALDFYSGYQYLLNRDLYVEHAEKIEIENILFYGYSLGAAAGLRGAVLIQEAYEGRAPAIIADRTFKNFASEAFHLLKPSNLWKLTNNPLFRFLIVILYPVLYIIALLAYLLVHLFGMNINATESWKTLALENKDKMISLHADNDTKIPYEASLASSIPFQQRFKVEVVYTREAHTQCLSEHDTNVIFNDLIPKLFAQEDRIRFGALNIAE